MQSSPVMRRSGAKTPQHRSNPALRSIAAGALSFPCLGSFLKMYHAGRRSKLGVP
jgi:hypothetical protein